MDQICELLDTFGQTCGYEACEEFRTVGISIAVDVEDGHPVRRVFPLCEEHLRLFLHDFAFGRRGRSALFDVQLGKRVEDV